ncbi:hypothetical protein B0T19DRAFT_438216 [Cercophora scortea]|uniref:N-acetyltransferase domain-containing protein n=1 Tax=Cercophora scortea TaxID=314031 RepID=A0AAE0J7B4_9PEZI|nr:hypothetical protein B0T19DRAFT_438216 [Cercophora scortea]
MTTPSPPPTPSLPEGYTLNPGFPSISDYRNLRALSGLSPVTEAQAAPIPTGSWYGCFITFTPPDTDTTTSTPVAMGRIIGDGGWYFLIADMAVLPAHQRRGLGDVVLKHLLGYIKTHAPAGPYVTLFADGPGRRLYAKNGFGEAMPGQMGMQLPMGWERG